MKKELKKEKSFSYLGRTFTPVIVNNGRYDWNKLAKKVWGNDDNLKPLEKINCEFNYSEFYLQATKNGCGKIDVFILDDGEKVIPCHILKYYGEPTWYAKKIQEELSEATFKRYQEKYLQEELQEIEKILLRKLNAAYHSGAIPEYWKETGNRLLTKAIINSFCKDMPYQMLDKKRIKESNNLHLFI